MRIIVFSILISSGDKLGLHDGLCKTDDGRVPTRIHAIFRLEFTNMETAMLSVTSATVQSPSIILLKDLVLKGVRREGGGRGGLNFRACVSGFVSFYEGTITVRSWSAW